MPSMTTSGPTPEDEKIPQILTLPPPYFTVGTQYLGFIRAEMGRLTYCFPSFPKRFTFDSSEKATFRQCSVVQCSCSLANTRRAFLFFCDIKGFFTAMRPNSPTWSNLRATVARLTFTSPSLRSSAAIRVAGFQGSTIDLFLMSLSTLAVVFRGRPVLLRSWIGRPYFTFFRR